MLPFFLTWREIQAGTGSGQVQWTYSALPSFQLLTFTNPGLVPLRSPRLAAASPVMIANSFPVTQAGEDLSSILTGGLGESKFERETVNSEIRKRGTEIKAFEDRSGSD